MPDFVGHPARLHLGKSKTGDARPAAGEDPVAGAKVAIEGEVRDLTGRIVHHRRVADAVEGEAPQPVPQVAPRIEVPVLAVVHEALRREGAFQGLVPRPAVVDDAHPAACEERLADGPELRGPDLAAGRVQDPHPPRHFRGRAGIAAEKRPRAVNQGLDVRPEQPRVHLLEQLAQREEGPDLGLVQPEPGERITGRTRRRFHESIAAAPPIPCDRRVQPIAEILEIALEGGARDFELFEKGLDRDDPPLPQQGIDPVEAFRPVHSSAPSIRLFFPSTTPSLAPQCGAGRRKAVEDGVGQGRVADLAAEPEVRERYLMV